MLERVLEGEVMSSPEEAKEYAEICQSQVNELFVKTICEDLNFHSGKIIDLGCGPGDIVIRIAQERPSAMIVGLDLSEEMLILAREKVSREKITSQVEFRCDDIKNTSCPSSSFDFIVSNSVAHHIPEPLFFFKEIVRLRHKDSGIFVKDLRRPNNQAHLEELVLIHTSNQSSFQKKMFHDSLHASLTLAELKEICKEAGLEDVAISEVGDLHWQVSKPFGRMSA